MALSQCHAPGKYEGELLVTEYLDQYSNEADESFADDNGGPSAFLLSGRKDSGLVCGDEREMRAFGLSDDDVAFLRAHAAVIIWERTDGFVSSSYYHDEAEARAEWSATWGAD